MQHRQQTDIHTYSGIRTRNPNERTATEGVAIRIGVNKICLKKFFPLEFCETLSELLLILSYFEVVMCYEFNSSLPRKWGGGKIFKEF